MSDLIRIVDLEVHAHIGVPEEERREPQRLLITLEMTVATITHAARTDELSRTINYHDVALRVKSLATKRPRKLIETLAEEIATEVLKTYPIQKLTIEVKKFILPDTHCVSVKIERSTTPPAHETRPIRT
jgi:dihydroneopterin aldolase